MAQGSYSLTDIEKPQSAGAYRLADAKPVKEDSPFVKGLKTFTPPLGAGSVYNADETKAALEKARNHPGSFLLDQVPFVPQIQRIRQQLKEGKPLLDVLAQLGGEMIAGAAGAPPVPTGIELPPSAPSKIGQALDSVADATLSKETASHIPVIGKAAVSVYERAKADFQKKQAAGQPPRVIRDPGERGIPPTLSYEPMERPAANPASQVGAPSALPSGRKPGGIQNQVPLTERVARGVQKTADESVTLDEIARSQTGKTFNKLTIPQQGVVRELAAKIEQPKAVEVSVTPVAAETSNIPTDAPVAAAPAAPVATPAPVAAPAAKPSAQSIAEQLRDEMLANGTITEKNLSVPSAPKPVEVDGTGVRDLMRDATGREKAIANASYAGDQAPEFAAVAYEQAARAEKANKLADALNRFGIKAEDAALLSTQEWGSVAKSIGINKPSKTAIAETLFRLKRLESK